MLLSLQLKLKFRLKQIRPAWGLALAAALPALMLQLAWPWQLFALLLFCLLCLLPWRLEYFKYLIALIVVLNCGRMLWTKNQVETFWQLEGAERLATESCEPSLYVIELQDLLWHSTKSHKSCYLAEVRGGPRLALILPSGYERVLLLEGSLKVLRPEPASNPGGFAEDNWLLGKGVYLKAELVGGAEILEERSALSLYFSNLSERWARRLEESLGQEVAAYSPALILGDKQGLDEAQKYAFHQLSLSHIIAVSGMHLVYLLLPLRSFHLEKCLGYRGYLILKYALCLAFYCLSSRPPGLYRAISVLFWRDLSQRLGYRGDSLNHIALSLTSALIHQPWAIFDRSLTWSYVAASALFILSPALQDFFLQLFGKEESKVVEALAATLSCQVAILCLNLGERGRISLLAPLWNLPFTLLFHLLFLLSLLLLFLAALPQVLGVVGGCWLGKILAWPFRAVNHCLLKLSSQSLPAFLSIPTNTLFYLALFLLLIYIFSARHKIWRAYMRPYQKLYLVLILLLFLFSQIMALWPQSSLVFLDVGQGDAMILSAGRKHILIDGGVESKATSVLLPYMEARGIMSFDVGIITHAHADHMAAAFRLARLHKVARFLLPERFTLQERLDVLSLPADQADHPDPAQEFLDFCESAAIPVERFSPGQSLQLSPIISLDCLAASRAPDEPFEDANESSIILKLQLENFRFILPADMTMRQEALLAKDIAADCDVYKVAHHGAAYNSEEELLNQMNACWAIVSVGARNYYGHPAPEVLKRLEEHHLEIYRTDEDGAIRLKSRGEALEIQTYKSKRRANRLK